MLYLQHKPIEKSFPGGPSPHYLLPLHPETSLNKKVNGRQGELARTLENLYRQIKFFAKPNVFLFPFNIKMSRIWI